MSIYHTFIHSILDSLPICLCKGFRQWWINYYEFFEQSFEDYYYLLVNDVLEVGSFTFISRYQPISQRTANSGP